MWLSFFPQKQEDVLCKGFGTIKLFNEYLLPSNESCVLKEDSDSELISYMHKGTLSLAGPTGQSEVTTAGVFRCMIILCTNSQKVTNLSLDNAAHFFRIFLATHPPHPVEGISQNQVHFTFAQRHNILCKIISPDPQKTVLHSRIDTTVYSCILDPGQHVVHALLPGRSAWLHMVSGAVTANGVDLAEGDGMGITDEASLSLTARKTAELLLIDTITDNTFNGRENTSR